MDINFKGQNYKLINQLFKIQIKCENNNNIIKFYLKQYH